MAAVTPVATVAALVRVLEKSGLVPADKLATIRERSADVSEPKKLARDLVKDGTLTKWQAEQLLNGFYRLVMGKFKLLDQLSSTPTGRLYLAEHAQMGRRHTLKVLAKRLAANPAVVKQFLDSARHACALDHRNISHIYDVNHDPEHKNHYVVMEYVEGETLEQLVSRGGPLELLPALNFIAQAAEGLAHAHKCGVVHGDLKPANLLCDQAGTLKILDMSQAGTGAAFETDNPDESIEMAALAAVIFQAPELRGDGAVVDVACDVYSLGSVLCFLLTGQAAPDAQKAAAALDARTGLPPEVAALCRSLMADQPAERPTSMTAVIEALGALAASTVAAEKTPEPPVPPPAAPPPLRTPETAEKQVPPAAETPQPLATKKPPVAKRLESDAVPPIFITEELQPVIEPEPVGNIVIKTKGRVGRKPATRLAAAEATQVAEAGANGAAVADAKAKPRARPKMTPLLLAGAIGGGGVLVLGLVLAIVLLFMFRGESSAPSAVTNSTGPAAVKQPAPPASESNPVPPPDEKNPEAAPLLGTGDGPPAATLNRPAGKLASFPADGEPAEPATPALKTVPATKSSEPAETSPAPAAAAPGESPQPAAAAAEAKPADAAPKAEPPAETPAPKAEAAAGPFEGFADVVDLPKLPDVTGPAAPDVLAPLALGPCRLEERTNLAITLHGGKSALRTPRQYFELQPAAGAPRQWDVLLSGAGAPVAVAGLSVNNDQLMFQWSEEGHKKQAAAAKQLCNCALELAAGPARHVVALRLPYEGPPLAVDIDKASGGSARWLIGDLPAEKSLFIEVTKAEGLTIVNQDPKQAINPNSSVTLWTGPKDKSPPLGLKMTASSTARGVMIDLLPQVRLAGVENLEPYRPKTILARRPQIFHELQDFKEMLEKAKKDRPNGSGEARSLDDQRIKKLREDLTKQVELRTTVLDQIAFLANFSEATQHAARVHFRVYHQASDKIQVDLLATSNDGESPGPDTTK